MRIHTISQMASGGGSVSDEVYWSKMESVANITTPDTDNGQYTSTETNNWPTQDTITVKWNNGIRYYNSGSDFSGTSYIRPSGGVAMSTGTLSFWMYLDIPIAAAGAEIYTWINTGIYRNSTSNPNLFCVSDGIGGGSVDAHWGER